MNAVDSATHTTDKLYPDIEPADQGLCADGMWSRPTTLERFSFSTSPCSANLRSSPSTRSWDSRAADRAVAETSGASTTMTTAATDDKRLGLLGGPHTGPRPYRFLNPLWIESHSMSGCSRLEQPSLCKRSNIYGIKTRAHRDSRCGRMAPTGSLLPLYIGLEFFPQGG